VRSNYKTETMADTMPHVSGNRQHLGYLAGFNLKGHSKISLGMQSVAPFSLLPVK
jgi:hypothetical protein